jgi:two-component system, cell cycle sensor histidine kinase and response regulator CckA
MWNRIPPIPTLTPFPPKEKRSLIRVLLINSILITLFLSTVYLVNPKGIQYLDNKSIDIILGKATAPDSKPEIVIVDIDEASLKKFGQWPWPRYLFAQLLKTTQDAGARSIGIDIIFPEQDRTSPKSWQENLTRDFGYIVDTSNLPAELLDYDIFLAKILAHGPFVLSYEFVFGKEQEEQSVCQLLPVSLAREGRVEGGIPNIRFYRANGVLCNYQPLANAAHSAGFLNGAPDPDGLVRRLPLLIEFKEKIYPSFALAVLLQFQDQRALFLRTDDFHIDRLSFAGLNVPLDPQGNFLLGPRPPIKSIHYSAAEILDGKIGAPQLQNKIVLIGSTAAGLAQGYPTPFSSKETLMDLQAAALRSLSSTLQTIRTPYFPFCEAAASLLLSLFLAMTLARWPTSWSVGVCLLAIGANWMGAEAIYQQSGFLFSPFLPTVTVIFNCFLLTTLKYRHFQLQAKSETGNALLLLKSSETSLESVLHTIPDIIFRLDGSGKFTFISPAICKYTKSPQSLLGKPIFDYVAPEDRGRAQYRLNERRTGERATIDLEIRLLFAGEDQKTQENQRFFSVSAEGIYRNNVHNPQEFLGTQGIVKDISDRKKLENQLLQAQKMEVVGNLAAGIAHDLNNILSGLVSYPDLLLLEIPKDNPLHDKISVIQKSGKMAAVIVQDLLTLARRNIAITGISNMNTIIAEYLDSVEFRRLQKKYPEITIHADLDNNLMNVKGSSVHLSKVMMNLLHNALEAMPAGGRVVISTRNSSLLNSFDGYEYIPAGEYVCTSVADNGVGIPQADIHRIFEPFYTRKTTDKSGTGLGMTIIWATIKDHDGYLDIRSQEGQGTTLTFYLPATTENTTTRQDRFVLEDYVGSETILIIDDLAEQRDTTRSILEKLGYTVLAASGGKEAVAIIQKQPVDLIILDMIMPGGIDGLETYLEILQISPNQKAIITSGFSESEQVKEVLRIGAGGYVQKPFTMEQIGIAVRKELQRS